MGMRSLDYLCLLVETISDTATTLVKNKIWREHNFISRRQNMTQAGVYIQGVVLTGPPLNLLSVDR